MKEAKIAINSVPLTSSQSATVRVAIESFASSLSELGNDIHGRAIAAAYADRIKEIRRVLYSHSKMPV